MVIAVHPYPRYINSDWILHEYISEYKEPFKWKRRKEILEQFDYGLVFNTYEEALNAAGVINNFIKEKISELEISQEVKDSYFLKAEKAIISRQRLQNEEKLMLSEALNITSSLSRPKEDEVILKLNAYQRASISIKDELLQEININPLIEIAHLKENRMVIGKHANGDWGRYLYYNEQTTKVAFREDIKSVWIFRSRSLGQSKVRN